MTTFHGDPDDAVLEQRARRLAQPLEQKLEGAIELLQFGVGAERCALETSFVRRVTKLPPLTAVPGIAEHFVGVVNLGGELVAVVDLCPLIGIARDEARSNWAIFLGTEHVELGIVVADPGQIEAVAPHAIDGPVRSRTTSSLVRGVLPAGVLVLDGSALLTDERLFVRDDAPLATPQGGTG